MFYSRGIYVLQFSEKGQESAGTWSGVWQESCQPRPRAAHETDLRQRLQQCADRAIAAPRPD